MQAGGCVDRQGAIRLAWRKAGVEAGGVCWKARWKKAVMKEGCCGGKLVWRKAGVEAGGCVRRFGGKRLL